MQSGRRVHQSKSKSEKEIFKMTKKVLSAHSLTRIISVFLVLITLALVPVSSFSLVLPDTSNALAITAEAATCIKKGSRGTAVKYLQWDLNMLNYGCGTADGIAGAKFDSAVRRYQRDHGLVVDGIVGNATKTSIYNDIKNIQRQLKNKGYNPGSVDGIAGTNTKNTLISFQKKNGLSADGICGPKTRTVLFSASSSSGSITTASSLDAFYNYTKANWSKPIRISLSCNPFGGARYFGANRSSGRKHAAIDLVVPHGTPVYAVAAGKVTRAYDSGFYLNTGAVEICNTDGSTVRYCEVKPCVESGQTVSKGQKIATVIRNTSKERSSMLHFELYRGTNTGALSNSSNKSYKYVPNANYQRRADLLDPSYLIKHWYGY